MFTGLVADVGRLARPRPRANGLRLAVQHHLEGGPLELGESVAVDGCCLTVVVIGAGFFDADLSPETLERTGGRRRWAAGRAVNLERALRMGDRLGGHLVQGHVDTMTGLRATERQPDGSARLRFERPSTERHLLVPKGSVALDGVSLTVASLEEDNFSVAVIPATLEATTLGSRRPGDALTLEYDIMGKYAAAAIEHAR